MLGLAEELGLGDRWRFRPTRVGFYGDGRLFSMTSPKEFLTFPLLRPHERARLAAFVARCQLTKEHDRLDDESARASGCERHCGKGVVEKLWKPLLDSKFDGNFDDLPGHLHLGADAPDGLDARQERARGHGLARGRLPDVDRRARSKGSSPWAARCAQGRPSSRSPPKAAAPSASSSTVACGASTMFSARWRRRWRAGCSHPSSSSRRRPTTAATSASSACCSGRRAASAPTTT